VSSHNLQIHGRGLRLPLPFASVQLGGGAAVFGS
jgi:hypothetical protein